MASGSAITFKRPDGSDCAGYLAMCGAGRPSVVVIQEWWGLNDQIRSVADRYATAGFNALAPDLYKGRIAQDADEASHLMNGLDFPGATHQDLRGAVQHLAALGGKVGVSGFCMGGALTIAAAVHVPGLSAAVCYYGIPPAGFASPADIAIPFQGHFANRDDWCTVAAVDQLASAMQGKVPAPEIYRYEADHAFFNQSRPEVFDAACAALAWERTLAFFKRYLS